MGKLDEIRALRERNYAERQTAREPVARQAKLKTAKAAVQSHVTDKSVTDKFCIICNEPFEAKRADAKICSAACRMRKRRTMNAQD